MSEPQRTVARPRDNQLPPPRDLAIAAIARNNPGEWRLYGQFDSASGANKVARRVRRPGAAWRDGHFEAAVRKVAARTWGVHVRYLGPDGSAPSGDAETTNPILTQRREAG